MQCLNTLFSHNFQSKYALFHISFWVAAALSPGDEPYTDTATFPTIRDSL